MEGVELKPQLDSIKNKYILDFLKNFYCDKNRKKVCEKNIYIDIMFMSFSRAIAFHKGSKNMLKFKDADLVILAKYLNKKCSQYNIIIKPKYNFEKTNKLLLDINS